MTASEKPWLALGISRSTWYRRHRKAREQAAARLKTLAPAGQILQREAAFDRAEAFAAALRRNLARCAALNAECAGIIAELTAMSLRAHRRARGGVG
jgi:hypothetical protein